MSDLSPILSVARDILRNAPGKALHVDSIAEEAVATNRNMTMSADVFSRKLQSALAANLKLKTQKPTFARVASAKKGVFRKGWYRLKQERTVAAIANVEPPEVSSAFIGRGGEHSVMGELLFWGYNVSMMAVDNGVDLVAEKNNVYFNVQVKTSTESSEGRYLFTVKRNAFLLNDKASMFYVLVIRKKVSNEYLVIPSSFIRTLIDASSNGMGSMVSLVVNVDERGRRYVLNGSTDVNLFVGNFGVIR